MEPVVTVGLDGSPESLAAARWAAVEAARRGLGLRLLHAWVLLAAAADVESVRDQNYWARRIVHDAHQELRRRWPDLAIEEELVQEDAAAAVLRAASDSELTVLGSRGLEPLESFFLGDTGMYIVARAERPVVLVRAGTPDRERPVADGGEVVAGVGLSGSCDELLEFAFAAAAARDVPLRAVHGRALPVQAYVPWGVDPDVSKELADEAQQELDQALRPWRERFADVRVIDDVRLESAAKAVVRAAADAALLVVGRRRHRVSRLGPVAHAAVHHVACPVAVVPHS
ncbi:universal stress protein [Streptomyces sp. LX-29]|uniref:universal stress protein n=1 Tax=Streptomyces sp. LX-29 TaxID=2900152 RepID=UPI00240E7BA1|nr:universal stress protein [Streptomyces sp. LX-29]WFB05787.1 universal stress protein [Streptomyces sp. LX-29]